MPHLAVRIPQLQPSSQDDADGCSRHNSKLSVGRDRSRQVPVRDANAHPALNDQWKWHSNADKNRSDWRPSTTSPLSPQFGTTCMLLLPYGANADGNWRRIQAGMAGPQGHVFRFKPPFRLNWLLGIKGKAPGLD